MCLGGVEVAAVVPEPYFHYLSHLHGTSRVHIIPLTYIWYHGRVYYQYIYIYICICTYIYIYTYTHIYIYIHMYIHMYIHIHIYNFPITPLSGVQLLAAWAHGAMARMARAPAARGVPFCRLSRLAALGALVVLGRV